MKLTLKVRFAAYTGCDGVIMNLDLARRMTLYFAGQCRPPKRRARQ